MLLIFIKIQKTVIEFPPFDSPVNLRNKLELVCSARKIARCLNQFGVFRRIARNVKFLKKRHLELRYNFVRDHQNWTQNQWDMIIWTGIRLKFDFHYSEIM